MLSGVYNDGTGSKNGRQENVFGRVMRIKTGSRVVYGSEFMRCWRRRGCVGNPTPVLLGVSPGKGPGRVGDVDDTDSEDDAL